jgi:hypothetical protein
MTGSDAAVLEIARKEYQLKARDNARTPVQVSSETIERAYANSSSVG